MFLFFKTCTRSRHNQNADFHKDVDVIPLFSIEMKKSHVVQERQEAKSLIGKERKKKEKSICEIPRIRRKKNSIFLRIVSLNVFELNFDFNLYSDWTYSKGKFKIQNSKNSEGKFKIFKWQIKFQISVWTNLVKTEDWNPTEGTKDGERERERRRRKVDFSFFFFLFFFLFFFFSLSFFYFPPVSVEEPVALVRCCIHWVKTASWLAMMK